MKLPICLTAITLLVPVAGYPFEQATHAAVTEQAYMRSILSSSGPEVAPAIRGLGLDTLAPFGEGWTYFKLLPGAPPSLEEHVVQDYERKLFNSLKIDLNAGSAATWLIVGAIREDDNPTENPPTPQDVDRGLNRPIHHFFDPYFNRPLVPLLSQKNVDWALGTDDSFTDPNAVNSNRVNRFTIPDAREAMFRALTLQTFSSGTWLDVSADLSPITRQTWRQAFWATAFRALGDVLHLNQDMAQPQHTRNEAHSGVACSASLGCLGGHSSIFEKYSNARALHTDMFSVGRPFNRSLKVPVNPLLFDGYSAPSFAYYASYWSTDPGNSSATGRGLGDYSNRGFFTPANNLTTSAYPYPAKDTSRYTLIQIAPPTWDGSLSADPTPVYVLLGEVEDAYQRSVTHDVPLTSYSVWDEFVKTKYPSGDFTLNRVNYDAMADLLIPRAVAYSAGLINFFFRGRIQISLPKEGIYAIADHGATNAFTTLRVNVENVTGAFVDPQGDDQPQHMRGGTFFAVVRYHKDKKYIDSLDTIVGTDPCDDYTEIVDAAKLDASTDCRDGVEQIAVSEPLPGESLDVNAQKTLKFSFSKSPIPYAMTDVILQIVYRGPLGSESDAVAVGSLDISEPTYFAYQNDTDYIHLGSHVYTRDEINADPSLLALVQPQYCVDYRQSPPRLIDGCLDTFPIDIDLSFDDIATPIAHASMLPARRFLRMVYLTDVNETFNPAIKSATRVASNSRLDPGQEKAYLYHQSMCLPLDPFFVRARESQMKVISQNQVEYTTTTFRRLRGVNGWEHGACVVNGDDSEPGAPDDRVSVMSSLIPDSDETHPYPITIAQEYQPVPEP